MVFGTNALVTKPAISFAPMLAVKLFNSYGYEELGKGTLIDIASLQHSMFTLACVIPIVIGAIQIALWSQYTITNSYMKTIKCQVEL